MALRTPDRKKAATLVRIARTIRQREENRARGDQWESERTSLRSYIVRVHKDDEGRPAVPPAHLERVIDVIEDDSLGNTVIIAPPGSAKTNTMIAAWAWSIGNHPNLHYGFFCNTVTQAQRRSVAIRDLIDRNADYQAIFPDVLPDRGKGWGESEWFVRRADDADKDATMTAAGVGSAIMGSRLNKVALDDIADPTNMATALQREKVISWIKETVMTRLAPDGRVIMICTRWHEADPAAWAIAQGWTVVYIDALQGPEGEETETYWPSRWPVNKIACPGDVHGTADPAWVPSDDQPVPPCWVDRDERGAILRRGVCQKYIYGSRQFNLIFRGKTTDDGSAVWKRSYWRRWDVLPAVTTGGIFVDLAHEVKTEADFTHIAVWLNKVPDSFLVDVIKRRLEFPDVVAILRALTIRDIAEDKWPKSADILQIIARAGRLSRTDDAPWHGIPIVIEDTPGSKPLIQTLKREVPGVIAWPIGGRDLIARSHACVSEAEAGNVYLPASAPWVGDWIEEHAAFPNGEHDDAVSTTTMALLRFKRGGRVYTW